MNLLTKWSRSYLPELPVDDRQLAEDLTLRGIAVEGQFFLGTTAGTQPTVNNSRFEMDITTNRVDAMNHYGVAREAAAIYNLALKPLVECGAAALKPTSQKRDVGHPVSFPVSIEASDLCGRFTARVIRGVTVGASSGDIAEYFDALGQKRISAPVDATNFGWLAMGQPTHVFDLDKISGGIVVRRAHAGEKLMLLDGTERTLVADDLVVADEVKALGLAGVMGGWDSRVTEQTTNILVEAAWFDPSAVRASSRRHGLHTDASHRFERGADFAAAPLANNLVTRLVVAQCGGEVVGEMTDVVMPAIAAKTASRTPIVLRVSEVQRHLGTTLEDAVFESGKRTSGLSENVIEQYLSALGCTLVPTGAFAGEYGVTLPSWRLDLEREIDLIEEVARVYGYNRFADTLPSFTGTVIEVPHAEQERIVRETLRALGYSEAISSTFTSAHEAEIFGDAARGAVAMGNPLSEEAGMLRPSLVPGMATMLANNLHRDAREVRLFEMGTVFTGSTQQVAEETGLAIGLTGGATASSLHSANDALIFEAKGAIEALLAKFAGTVTFDAKELPRWIVRGRGARALLDGKVIAVFGELAEAETQRLKLRQPAVFAEVQVAVLLKTSLRQPVSSELSRFQSVERDFSFVFPDSVSWSSIAAAISTLQIAEMRSAEPVEIFRDAKGKTVAAGSYSILVRVVFQAQERTLSEDELGAWTQTILTALTTLGGIQRA